MNSSELNATVNKYVKDNLSPKLEQREYIVQKYQELSSFLKNNCFQSGSYPRFMAINPVHDLDIIHPVRDLSLKDDSKLIIDTIYGLLVESYANSKISRIKNIKRQTHSITIEFDDCETEFSIDVVPAVEISGEFNEFGDSLYYVPEILHLNHSNRLRKYSESINEPINWIKSDPKGYLKSSHNLNDLNNDFRHTAKIFKSWRHACKTVYGDRFKLKSFHLEQIVYNYFRDNPLSTTLEALMFCFSQLPNFLDKPHFPDRANSEKFIDIYISELSLEEKNLILKLQIEAFSIVRKLVSCSGEDSTIYLNKLLTINEVSSTPPLFSSTVLKPSQPWAL